MSLQDPVRADVAIIGAGPVGLFAVFQFGMLGMSCHLIDALDEVGGQCTALYPEKPIYDIPGYPQVAAGDLISQLEAQAAPFKANRVLGQQVVAITGDVDSGFMLETSRGANLSAKLIVIAAGGGAFGPNRPPLEGLEHFEGTSVFYLVKRREDFRDKRVVIAGGGDSAVDWALSLSEITSKLYLVHRRDRFRAAPDSLKRLQECRDAGRIEMVAPFQLAALDGEEGQLRVVTVKDLDGNHRDLEVDCLLPFYGLASSLGPIADWHLELQKSLIAVDPASCETNRSGIFAIGDIATYPGKLKLILQGFADAAAAAHVGYGYVFPDTALHFEYSTTKGVSGR